MKLAAVVVVGSDVFGNSAEGMLRDGGQSLPRVSSNSLACLEVLGRSLLKRMLDNLDKAGVQAMSVIADARHVLPTDVSASTSAEIFRIRRAAELGDAVEIYVNKYADEGTDGILLIKLDAYVELDFIDVLELAKDRGLIATRANDLQGPLKFWAINGPRARKHGFCLAGLMGGLGSRGYYRLQGYVNRLSSARDLRKLVVDGFHSRCALRPCGIQVKPGVWVDSGASVHRLARIVAPVYVGRDTQVHSGALLTRCTHLEQGCSVGQGTVVEDTSVLANTFLGSWLDISHAVVDGTRFVHLKRNVALEISDPALIGVKAPATRDAEWVDPIRVPTPLEVPIGGGPFGLPAQVA